MLLLVRVALIAALLCFALFQTDNDAAAESRIKLGFSGPLSGPGAGWGEDVRNVLIFANEKLAGGKYSFVFEDDRCDLKDSLSVARKLTFVDKVTVVFVVCGQAVLSAAKTYTESGVPVMAPLATPSRISGLGVFRTGLSDAFAATMLAEYIRRAHRSVAVLTEENEYPVSFLHDFVRSAATLDLKVHNTNYLPNQQDFRAQLVKMKAEGVTALFLNIQTEQGLLNILKQAAVLDFHPALFGAYLPGSAKFLQIGAHLAEGLVFVDYPGADEVMTAYGKSLLAEYTARFGDLHGWSFAFPATFEAFRAIHTALESGIPVERYLKGRSFHGVMGKYSFDEHGDVSGPHHVLRRIHERRGMLVEVAPRS